MSDTRQRIRAHVHANAGVHFNDLARELTLAPGQIQYHVRRLISDGEIVREEFYGRTHYFPPSYGEWERGAIALFRRETARTIVVTLLERGPSRPGEITADLDIARSTLEYHLEHLDECDVVEKRYDQRSRVTLRVVDPNRSASLLVTIRPTVSDRLTDRFTRLVDGLFEDTDETP